MRPHGNHCGVGGQTRCPGPGQQCAHGFAGLDKRREDVPGQPECVHEFRGPLTGNSVKQTRSGRVGGFSPPLARQQESDQVRDQEGLHPVQPGFRCELVQGVELQVLQTCDGVQLLRGNQRMDPFHRGPAALVPVAERLRGEFTGVVHQTIVNRPRVDADAHDALAVPTRHRSGSRQSLEYLREQGVEVPAEAAVELHNPVGEAVNRLERHPGRRRNAAQHESAGGHADVDGGKDCVLSGHRPGVCRGGARGGSVVHCQS